MTREEFEKLEEGDFVTASENRLVFIVTGDYRSRVTVTRTMDMTNPCEWTLYGAPLHTFKHIEPGDLVRGVASGHFYVVARKDEDEHGIRATCVDVREVSISNMHEWEIRILTR